MALKFLNKKGWHTGSLRNIENVWKAEQKRDAEQKKLEELRKQIQEERERSEFRLLQERAGLVPRQERLDFLYESGLGVGKGSSDVFKALETPTETPTKAETSAAAADSSASKAAVPGALFEDKPQSANDSWRKLHSDPLLLIRQREQEALARIKNNPIQMAMIRKSVEAEKKHKEKGDKKEKREKKEHKKKHRHSKSKHDKHSSTVHSDSEDTSEGGEERRRDRPASEHHRPGFNLEVVKRRDRLSSKRHRPSFDREQERRDHPASEYHRPGFDHEEEGKDRSASERHCPGFDRGGERRDRPAFGGHFPSYDRGPESNRRETQTNVRRGSSNRSGPKLSEEERAARIQEMQLDAELHEEQRWKRLKKASEADARESVKDGSSGGRNFLDAAQKSIYGTVEGGSATIEDSVRRRTYYLQGGSAAHESNAFRRR